MACNLIGTQNLTRKNWKFWLNLASICGNKGTSDKNIDLETEAEMVGDTSSEKLTEVEGSGGADEIKWVRTYFPYR